MTDGVNYAIYVFDTTVNNSIGAFVSKLNEVGDVAGAVGKKAQDGVDTLVANIKNGLSGPIDAVMNSFGDDWPFHIRNAMFGALWTAIDNLIKAFRTVFGYAIDIGV